MIKVNSLSKKFKIYENTWHRAVEWAAFGRKKLHQEFWALRNVSFEVTRGECLGIIGSNGAGKSTLLKILTRALYPTSGTFEIQGMVLSLLELGTGFNDELTGRQNLYTSVNLLGFPVEYLENRITDIEAFAELGDFFDRPIKLYSTGMYVRLAFSMFVFLQPDVLIIDETLSVGDVFFQQKSFAKIREIIAGGTTCLFVSHDTVALQNLCRQAILLEKGEIAFIGDAREAVSRYHGALYQKRNGAPVEKKKTLTAATPADGLLSPPEILAHNILIPGKNRHGKGGLEIVAVRVTDEDQRDTLQAEMMGTVILYLLIRANEHIVDPSAGIHLFDRMGNLVFAAGTRQLGHVLPELARGDELVVRMALKLPVQPGEYTFSLGASEPLADFNPNVGIIQDRHELLGPLSVIADSGKLMPFYGIARLPMEVEYGRYPKAPAAGEAAFRNIKPGLDALIGRMCFEEAKRCWCGGALQPWTPELDDYLQCGDCGCKTVRFRPTVQSLKEFYAGRYWYEYQRIHDCPPIEARYETDMLDRVPTYLSWIRQRSAAPERILEIGCGAGRLSHELAKAGYNVLATEMDPDIARWVIEKTGLSVLAGDFPPIDQAPYDIIVIIDVMEHVCDPVNFVHEVKARIGPNGRVFLHCPVMDTLEEALALKHLYNPLSHLWMHTTASMNQLWQRVGMKPEKIGELFAMPFYVLTENEKVRDKS